MLWPNACMQVGQRVRKVKGEGAGKVGEVVGTVPNGKIRVKKEEGPPSVQIRRGGRPEWGLRQLR